MLPRIDEIHPAGFFHDVIIFVVDGGGGFFELHALDMILTGTSFDAADDNSQVSDGF